jgi:cell division initiation protein
MKITPLDIQQREFKVALRGYDRSEVEAFLRSVSKTVEELVKENAGLKERVEALGTQVNDLGKKEAALNELLVTTQAMSETLKQTARREADLILKEAELKSEELLKRAQTEYEGLQREILALQKQRIVALEKLRSFLQSFNRMVELEELDRDSLPADPAGKALPRDRYEGV